MSAEANITIVKRLIDEFNQGKFDYLDEVCSANFIYHGPTNPNWDITVIKKVFLMMYTAFPDWKITLEDIFATEDKAAYRLSIQGTHLGEIFGVPPSGKQIVWTSIEIDHFADGKLVERWDWMDFLGFRRQLGLIPEAAGV